MAQNPTNTNRALPIQVLPLLVINTPTASGHNDQGGDNNLGTTTFPPPPPAPPLPPPMIINQEQDRRRDQGGYYKDYVTGGGRRYYLNSTLYCEECGAEMDRSMALYYYSGVGPICFECSEDPDSEYFGYKFEPRYYKVILVGACYITQILLW